MVSRPWPCVGMCGLTPKVRKPAGERRAHTPRACLPRRSARRCSCGALSAGPPAARESRFQSVPRRPSGGRGDALHRRALPQPALRHLRPRAGPGAAQHHTQHTTRDTTRDTTRNNTRDTTRDTTIDRNSHRAPSPPPGPETAERDAGPDNHHGAPPVINQHEISPMRAAHRGRRLRTDFDAEAAQPTAASPHLSAPLLSAQLLSDASPPPSTPVISQHEIYPRRRTRAVTDADKPRC